MVPYHHVIKSSYHLVVFLSLHIFVLSIYQLVYLLVCKLFSLRILELASLLYSCTASKLIIILLRIENYFGQRHYDVYCWYNYNIIIVWFWNMVLEYFFQMQKLFLQRRWQICFFVWSFSTSIKYIFLFSRPPLSSSQDIWRRFKNILLNILPS